MSDAAQLIQPGSKALLAQVPVREIGRLEQDGAEDAFWLVDARNLRQAEALAAMVRRNSRPSLYLKPLVFLVDAGGVEVALQSGADAVISIGDYGPEQERALRDRFTPIHHWIEQHPELSACEDTDIPLKLLRHISSRDLFLEPVVTCSLRCGFLYPPLEPYVGNSGEGIMEVLAFLEQERLLSGEFSTRAHFCTHCDCAFLNFQEVCPHCRSANLQADELVHHFRCGHTAPLADYQGPHGLICPKCDRPLRQIGVDYDKPSVVFGCNDCDHRFQEPDTLTRCFDCGRTTAPEHQRLRVIQRYKITAIGQNAAYYGLESLFTRVLKEDLGLVPWDTFATFVRVEGARIARYQISRSSLLCVSLQDLEKVYLQLGSRAADVFHELSAVFKSVLRRSDLITARNETIFLILLAETDEAQAKRALERLESGVSQLLEANLNHRSAFVSRLTAVDETTDPEALVEELLAGNAD